MSVPTLHADSFTWFTWIEQASADALETVRERTWKTASDSSLPLRDQIQADAVIDMIDHQLDDLLGEIA